MLFYQRVVLKDCFGGSIGSMILSLIVTWSLSVWFVDPTRKTYCEFRRGWISIINQDHNSFSVESWTNYLCWNNIYIYIYTVYIYIYCIYIHIRAHVFILPPNYIKNSKCVLTMHFLYSKHDPFFDKFGCCFGELLQFYMLTYGS